LRTLGAKKPDPAKSSEKDRVGQYSKPDQKPPGLNVDRIDIEREPETSAR
jgi:hypothetical protein